MEEHTYCFEDYEIFVVTVNGKVTEVYTYFEDLKPDTDVTIKDDNPLNEFKWTQITANKVFAKANNPQKVYSQLMKFFTKV